MHHVVLERWSRGTSFLHRRDPRVKILALLIFLIAVATTHREFELPGLAYFAVLVVGMIAARLPVFGILRRAALVLPFSLTLAAVTWISGDPRRAVMVVEKSFLSASAALLLAASTPLPQLLRGLEMLGTPRFLLMVAQFVYRYLFVIAEQGQRMRLAAQCRGGRFRRKGGFRAAAGMLAVLFARSYGRADRIHRSMISRGFEEHFKLVSNPRLGWADAGFLCLSAALIAAVRI